MAAARSPRDLTLDEIREIREALAHRRAAGQPFEDAWCAVLRGLPARMLDELWSTSWQWRSAYLRRPATGVAVLLDVLEDARQGERIVLG